MKKVFVLLLTVTGVSLQTEAQYGSYSPSQLGSQQGLAIQPKPVFGTTGYGTQFGAQPQQGTFGTQARQTTMGGYAAQQGYGAQPQLGFGAQPQQGAFGTQARQTTMGGGYGAQQGAQPQLGFGAQQTAWGQFGQRPGLGAEAQRRAEMEMEKELEEARKLVAEEEKESQCLHNLLSNVELAQLNGSWVPLK